MATSFTRERWIGLAKQWWFVLAVVGVVVLVGVIVGVRSVVLSNRAAENQFKEETKAMQSLATEGTDTPQPTQTPTTSEDGEDDKEEGGSSDWAGWIFAVSNKGSYDTSMTRRDSVVERLNNVVELAMNWDSSKVYMANRAKIIEMGVPEDSQLLKVAMPPVASNVIDGVVYDEIDLYKLTQSASAAEGTAGDVHVFSVDKKLVAVTVVDVRQKNSSDPANVSRVLVRLVFDEEGKEIVDGYIGVLSESVLCIPDGCGTDSVGLTTDERNGGSVEN